MSYKTAHHYSFSHSEARDALVDYVRKNNNPTPLPVDNNAVQLLVLGGELILVWETKADTKPAWLPKTEPLTNGER